MEIYYIVANIKSLKQDQFESEKRSCQPSGLDSKSLKEKSCGPDHMDVAVLILSIV